MEKTEYNRRYTEEEDKIILKQVSENPTNIRRGLKQAAVLIGRTFHAVEIHWYKSLSKNPNTGVCFATVGKKSYNINRKIVTKSAYNEKVHNTGWWERFLTLLDK